MQKNLRQFLLAVCVSAIVATTGLTGCKSDHDRTAGRAWDDRKVARAVKKTLSNDPTYKYPDVRVQVFAGIAQLSGFVDNPDQKAKAGELAQRVEGVHQVQNALALKPQAEMQSRTQSNAPSPTGSSTSRHYYDATTTPPPTPYNTPPPSSNPNQP
jgi:hyperosmotically inducible protein